MGRHGPKQGVGLNPCSLGHGKKYFPHAVEDHSMNPASLGCFVRFLAKTLQAQKRTSGGEEEGGWWRLACTLRLLCRSQILNPGIGGQRAMAADRWAHSTHTPCQSAVRGGSFLRGLWEQASSRPRWNPSEQRQVGLRRGGEPPRPRIHDQAKQTHHKMWVPQSQPTQGCVSTAALILFQGTSIPTTHSGGLALTALRFLNKLQPHPNPRMHGRE